MEFEGTTIEEAIQTGLATLNIQRIKAHITVIQHEKSGFWGFRKRPALVDIEEISEMTAIKADQKAVRGVPKEVNDLNEPVTSILDATVDLGKVVAAVKEYEREHREEIDDSIKEEILKNEQDIVTVLEETGYHEIIQDIEGVPDTLPLADIRSYLEGILTYMEVTAILTIKKEGNLISVHFKTDMPSRLIGYHGTILKALQVLTKQYLYHMTGTSVQVVMDVNDYMTHRVASLENYIRSLVDGVLEDDHPRRTNSLSQADRKLVHQIVEQFDGVISHTEGEEPHAYVSIEKR